MNMEGRPTEDADLWIGVAVSGAVHLSLLAALVVAWLVSTPTDDEAVEDEESMEVVLEDEPRARATEEPEWLDDTPEEVSHISPEDESFVDEEEEEEDQEEEEDEAEEEEETKDEEEEPDEEFPDDQLWERYAVDQQTDDEEPDEADHISDEAHRTDEETVAEVTTLEDVEEPEEPEALEQVADMDRELAMETPEEEPVQPDLVDPDRMDEPDETEEDADEIDEEAEFADEVDDEESQERHEEEAAAEQESDREWRDPAEMFVDDREADAQAVDESWDREAVFGRDSERADEVLGGEKSEDSRVSKRRSDSGRQLLSNWRENEEAMRAALENFIPHVQPGNHTSVNATSADHASYIARMHRSIHSRWAERFIPRISRNFSSRHELNDMGLEAVVEIVIDAEAEEVVDTVRVQPSGSDLFDAEALTIARTIDDVSDPPDSIVSPDGNIYIHWTFWRDQRRCGTFGVRIYEVQNEEESRP